VHWRGIEEEATNFAFFPVAQHPDGRGRFSVVARTESDAASVLPDIRETIERLEGNLSLEVLSTMEEEVGQVLMPQRVGSVLLSGFAALALLLSGVGVFGLVSYTVREQRRAIGVRMAVGASRGDVVREVASGMVTPLLVGLALGLIGGMVVDDAAARFLYGVAPGDPLTYGAIAAALFTAMVISTLVPARQAARVDAMRALRAE
jgi:putative ABC transport system permease protein